MPIFHALLSTKRYLRESTKRYLRECEKGGNWTMLIDIPNKIVFNNNADIKSEDKGKESHMKWD